MVLHVGAALLLVPTTSEQLEVVEVTEVDLVDRPAKPETTEPERKERQENRAAQARRRRARARKARRRRPRPQPAPAPAPRLEPETDLDQEISDLLSMRPEPAPEPDPPVPHPDRFASFWAGGKDSAVRRPRTVSRVAVAGIEQERHDDGGRVLRSTGDGAEPSRGTVGLVRLAGSRLGSSDGYQACDPYRGFRGNKSRHLILLVDTSSSVVLRRHAPDTIICAAGAALSALQRGFDVTVINFSTISYRYGPTRDIDVVYDALSFQAQGTVLPREALRDLDVGDPWDLVLITDAAIQNLEKTLPSYASTLKRRVGLRAMLFYLGDEALDGVAMLERIGFRPRYVEGS